MVERKSPEDKHARRVFLHLEAIMGSISEKAEMVSQASASPAFRQAISESTRAFMRHVSHPDTDLDTVDIHGWPWPKAEDYPAEARPFVEDAAAPQEPPPDPRDAELAALRARVAELEARDASVFAEPPPLSPHPDELMSDYGPVGEDAITGDMLLDAFEADPTETAAVVKTLSATRLKHLSEQLNVTRAALDREHSATGIANPRSAAIDRLLNLLIRRGEV